MQLTVLNRNHDAIVWDNAVTTVGGTSASSPTFASVISLVNDARLAKGMSSLGFLNPWLYKKGYDILLVTLPFHGARREPGHDRPLEDDLEATIYLARGTLEATGFAYRGPEEPAPGY